MIVGKYSITIKNGKSLICVKWTGFTRKTPTTSLIVSATTTKNKNPKMKVSPCLGAQLVRAWSRYSKAVGLNPSPGTSKKEPMKA